MPGTQCDERVWLPLWQYGSFELREYVPLQWANSLDDMLSLCDDRVSRHSQPVHLLGYSMGGYIAAEYLRHAPARAIASVTMIGYAPQGLSKTECEQREMLLDVIKKGQYPGMTTRRLKNFVHDSRRNDDNVAGVVTAMDVDLGSNVLQCHLQATSHRPDMTAVLTRAANKGLKIHFIGAEDDLIAPPKKLQQAASLIPNSSCKIFTDSAHMLPLEQPRALCDYLHSLMGG